MKRLFLFAFSAIALSMSALAQCSDLYISEYVEGSGNNKAVEFYNPTNATIDLSNYVCVRLNGGSTSPDTFGFNGMLAPYDVYIVGNSSADASILAETDTTNALTFYNGDDALILINIKDKKILDIFGTPGVDPGSQWTVGTGASREYTLVRKSTIKEGQMDWTKGANEWDVYPQNTATYLGSHTSDCYVPANPEIGFASSSAKVMETAGSVKVSISIANPSATNAASAMVYVTGGTAVSGTDYTATSPSTLNFAAGATADQEYSITITDNMMSALDKTIELTLRSVTGADLTKDSTMTITIENDDYWVAKINEVRENDDMFRPKYDKQKVEVQGIVYGIDYDGNEGLSFTIIDSTAGINIFNFNDVSDYTVTEGDDITVRGSITSYNGLTEVLVDSIKVNSQNNTLKAPMVVAAPSEDTESDFIEVRKVWITDGTTTWPDNGNVELTNGTDTFLIRIDRDLVDIVGQSVVADTMDIMGIGGQFDNSSDKRDGGYQIFPRNIDDIKTWNKASVKDFTLVSNVYPNPSNGLVTISAAQVISNITVVDALGNTVANQSVNNTTTDLDLTNVASGVYFITINAENASSVKRVVIK